MSRKLYLDTDGDWVPSADLKTIANERELLTSMQYACDLHIVGKSLCAWAEQIAMARGYEIQLVHGYREQLVRMLPAASSIDIQLILDTIRSHDLELPSQLTPQAILTQLLPAQLWVLPLGPVQAAQWLCWLLEDMPDALLQYPFIACVFSVLTDHWEREAERRLLSYYKAKSADESHRCLVDWLNIERLSNEVGQVLFPIDVPAAVIRYAALSWATSLVTTNGHFAEKMMCAVLEPALRRVANDALFDYFSNNVRSFGALDITLRLGISTLWTDEQNNKINQLLPPKRPDLLPQTLSDVLEWFELQYLPYRTWQALYGSHDDAEYVYQMNLRFAKLILDKMPGLIHNVSNPYHKLLNIYHGREVRQCPANVVTLWVITDGMPFTDMNSLSSKLRSCIRLSELKIAPAFATLPTITRFCKPALMNGVPNSILAEDSEPIPVFENAVLLRRDSDPAMELRGATGGKVYVWNLVQPDRTYHQRGMDLPSMRRSVDGELSKIANAISTAVQAVPDTFMMRIVISTDHGRLLQNSERIHPVPVGMESHGRAAYGIAPRPVTNAEGYIIEGSVALISGDRFGLPHDVAVSLDSNAFLKNNDATGNEGFLHGGLFLEEVIVPTAVAYRDLSMPPIKATISGSGTGGKAATAVLTIINAGNGQLSVSGFGVSSNHSDKQSWALSLQLLPQQQIEQQITFDHWFTSTQLGTCNMVLTVTREDGAKFEIPVANELKVMEMYSQANILEDLI